MKRSKKEITLQDLESDILKHETSMIEKKEKNILDKYFDIKIIKKKLMD
jgi:hypothetical protein